MQQKWWWHQQILGGVCIVKQGAAINKHPTHNENAEIETGGARRLKRGCHGEKAFRPNFFKIKKKENPNLNSCLPSLHFTNGTLSSLLPSLQNSSSKRRCRKSHGRRDTPPSTPVATGSIAGENLTPQIVSIVVSSLAQDRTRFFLA